jgi:hypothetical protein
LVNHSPNTAKKCKTPEEVWSGKPADYSNLRIFSCPTYAHVNEDKLEPGANKCIFLGYASSVKRVSFMVPGLKKGSKFIISRYMTFDKIETLKAKESQLAKELIK